MGMSTKTYVIKFGGNALSDETAKRFAESVKTVKDTGANLIIVHGGGPQINAMLEQLNIQSHFVNGMRFTDDKTLAVAEMVLAGSVNKMLTKNLLSAGVNAVGLSGTDGNLLTATKLTQHHGEPIDLGYVGEVQAVNTELLTQLLNAGLTPVIAPIANGNDYQTLNINADIAAGEIAKALAADALILMTNISGLLDAKQEVIHHINKAGIEALIQDGIINGGMIPKVQAALDVLQSAKMVKIIDGRAETSLVDAILNKPVGTTISA